MWRKTQNQEKALYSLIKSQVNGHTRQKVKHAANRREIAGNLLIGLNEGNSGLVYDNFIPLNSQMFLHVIFYEDFL